MFQLQSHIVLMIDYLSNKYWIHHMESHDEYCAAPFHMVPAVYNFIP